MKELDVNTQQKNLIEEDRLQSQIFKLNRSGRRATNQISRFQKTITNHCLDVTCKTDRVTDERKRNSFQIMKASRPRPLSAIHIPSSEGALEEGKVKVFKDRLGRPAFDVERMNQERSDRFYHHKIDKLMDMMENHKTSRRKSRSKSAPVKKNSKRNLVTVPFETFDINNIPDARPITASDAEFQFKKIRASLEKKPSSVLLYGDVKEETLVRKHYKPNSSSGTRRQSTSPRRMSGPGSALYSAARKQSQTPVMMEDDLSDISEYEAQVMRERTKFLQRRQTYKSNQIDAPGSMNNIGSKIKQYHDKKYPSRFLHPNPDYYSRLLPYPVILDKEAYEDFCKRVERVKTTSEMKRDLDDLVKQHTIHKPINAWDHGPQFKTYS